MCTITVFVTLKIPDNIARTAHHTLTSRLRCTTIRTLKRSEYWEIRFSGLESTQAEQIVERWVQKTSLFMNPNKHRYSILASHNSITEKNSQFRPDMNAAVLVCDQIDGKAEATFETLCAMATESEKPAALFRGVWWDLAFENLSPDAIRETVERITITVSRTEGLFANPHYQTYHTFFRDTDSE
ncbi:MAG: hypothetical protein C4527_15370 [Candidatus Omnitrophota bacterium]|nr:MAG: hypothetical protein C4527_15370 [Candidatus Omnitrophota bacterium]